MGQNAFFYGNAGQDNSTVALAQPGTAGTGIDALLPILPAPIKAYPEWVTHIAMNWGANDMNGSLTESTWVSQYGSLVSYLHGRYPNAEFWIAYPWRRGYDTQAATMRGWVDSVISNCAGIGVVCHAGPDEAVSIKASDNGLLETDAGGVHYTNPLGVGLYATAMKAALGY